MISQNQLDSFLSFRTTEGQVIRGTIITVQRHSLVMEVYLPYSLVKISEVLHAVTVKVGSRTAYCGRAVVSNLVNTGLTVVASVTLVDEWRDFAENRSSAGGIGAQAKSFIGEWDARNPVPIRQQYQAVVNGMRAFLSEVSRWVDQVDLAGDLPRDGAKLRADVFHELAAPIMDKMRFYFDDFEQEAGEIDEAFVSAHSSFVQSAVHPLLLRAPFVHRTYSKPLGYAGDYEMVNQILGDPQDGPSTYFQIINNAFLAAPVVRAHRNRIDVLVRYLTQLADQAQASGRSIKVLNVGCGPAVEVQRFIRDYPRPEVVRFELVDFNEETLAYARSRIHETCEAAGKRVDVTFLRESVNDLIKMRPDAIPLRDCDAVYCAGLFDYLSDRMCNRLISYFTKRSRAGASFLFTNVHVRNPDRLGMEHLLEWYLVYRDDSGMRSIAHRDHVNLRIYSDETGVNVFAESNLPDDDVVGRNHD